MSFSLRLKEIRENKRLSQQQLADAIGEKQSSVGSWESGKSYPRHKTLVKLADYLDISIDYLTDRTDLPGVVQKEDKSFSFAPHEKEIVLAYREMSKSEKAMICKMLDIRPESD